jgi:hypothetical protein
MARFDPEQAREMRRLGFPISEIARGGSRPQKGRSAERSTE